MIINILIGDRAVGEAIATHLKSFLLQRVTINILLINNANALSKDILKTDLWITDIWNPENPDDPEGFRTVMQLAGKTRVLLIFYAFYSPELGDEGPFWISLVSDKPLAEKVGDVLNSPLPTKKDFDNLVMRWPLLGKDLSKHRCHHSHNIRNK
ncbi:MAG: hypothetical protein L6263_05045 [Desulfobacteraceae bacterium]|nr:hypothetical protein [Desulfobacteraceae bacterium]MCG2831309.1 hypothetical protein [Desulfobacteraceae bacterium]